MPTEKKRATLQKLRRYIESLCGIYSRVARRLGVDRTYVSRVAKGEKHSPEIENALIKEFEEVDNEPADRHGLRGAKMNAKEKLALFA